MKINVIQCVSKIKDKNHMMISIDAEKAFGNNPVLICDKNTQQTKKRWKLPQVGKEHLWKNPQLKIMLNGERLRAFPPRSGTR